MGMFLRLLPPLLLKLRSRFRHRSTLDRRAQLECSRRKLTGDLLTFLAKKMGKKVNTFNNSLVINKIKPLTVCYIQYEFDKAASFVIIRYSMTRSVLLVILVSATAMFALPSSTFAMDRWEA